MQPIHHASTTEPENLVQGQFQPASLSEIAPVLAPSRLCESGCINGAVISQIFKILFSLSHLEGRWVSVVSMSLGLPVVTLPTLQFTGRIRRITGNCLKSIKISAVRIVGASHQFKLSTVPSKLSLPQKIKQ